MKGCMFIFSIPLSAVSWHFANRTKYSHGGSVWTRFYTIHVYQVRLFFRITILFWSSQKVPWHFKYASYVCCLWRSSEYGQLYFLYIPWYLLFPVYCRYYYWRCLPSLKASHNWHKLYCIRLCVNAVSTVGGTPRTGERRVNSYLHDCL